MNGLAEGTRVHLIYGPYGEPGVVRGMSRGKVLVEWTSLGISGKHKPESLLVVS